MAWRWSPRPAGTRRKPIGVICSRPAAVLVRHPGGRMIASCVLLRYPPGVGWIGMALVHGPWRKRGYATRLLRCAIEASAAEGLTPNGLCDAGRARGLFAARLCRRRADRAMARPRRGTGRKVESARTRRGPRPDRASRRAHGLQAQVQHDRDVLTGLAFRHQP